jgi:hypothetical protein
MDFPYGAEVCSGAMLNLVTYGSTARDNRTVLRDAGLPLNIQSKDTTVSICINFSQVQCSSYEMLK